MNYYRIDSLMTRTLCTMLCNSHKGLCHACKWLRFLWDESGMFDLRTIKMRSKEV